MTDQKYALSGTLGFLRSLNEIVEWWRNRADRPEVEPGTDLAIDTRPLVGFITLQSYSTYVIRSRSSGSYDQDGDDRSGQKYVSLVDGFNRVPVALLDWDQDGNHKQMIEFTGDSVHAEIKLVLDGHETDLFSLTNLTEEDLTTLIEALPNVGKKNVKVSMWPGHWLIEFVNKLAGKSFPAFEIDLADDATFDCWAYEFPWSDSGEVDEVLFTIPLAGEWDGDDNVINDAVAAGSFGTAGMMPAAGLVVLNCQCRDYNEDGTPNL